MRATLSLSSTAPAAAAARKLGMACLMALTAVLSGCALSPGLNVASKLEPALPPAEEPPPGALTRITPALVLSLQGQADADPKAELKPFMVAPEPYRIGPADVLSVIVWGSPDFFVPATSTNPNAASTAAAPAPTGFTVNSTGFIQIPYIGSVRAAGLTEEELRDSLNKLLAPLVKRPQVTVGVQTYRSSRIYVDGEVRKPGQVVIDDVPMSLPEAINRAGGLTPAADRSAVTLNRGLQSVRINLDQLTSKGIDPQGILLARGDVLRVESTEDTRVYVLGEVSGPGAKPLRKGKLTLHEALADAGGISTSSADPRQIYVFRVTNPLKPEIYHLDATSPAAFALAEGFSLKPKDMVYVDPVPLVRWNRVINLLLPSASALTTVNQASGLGTNR